MLALSFCVRNPTVVDRFHWRGHSNEGLFSFLLIYLRCWIISLWISQFIHHKVWDEFTYPVPNCRHNRWSLGVDNWFHPILFWAGDYLSIRSIHVSKKVPLFHQKAQVFAFSSIILPDNVRDIFDEVSIYLYNTSKINNCYFLANGITAQAGFSWLLGASTGTSASANEATRKWKICHPFGVMFSSKC